MRDNAGMQIHAMQLLRRTLSALLLSAGLAQAQPAPQTTVVILRHAEKPEAGLGQLNCKGLNRALALAPLLLSRYGRPNAIYAPNPAQPKNDKGILYAYIRPLATIEPTAVRAGLPVQIAHGMEAIQPLAAQLLAQPPGLYFVAWEHHWAQTLARSLVATFGGNSADVPVWDDADFDSLYVLRLRQDAQGRRSVDFRHEQQNLNALPEECSAADAA